MTYPSSLALVIDIEDDHIRAAVFECDLLRQSFSVERKKSLSTFLEWIKCHHVQCLVSAQVHT